MNQHQRHPLLDAIETLPKVPESEAVTGSRFKKPVPKEGTPPPDDRPLRVGNDITLDDIISGKYEVPGGEE